MAAVTGSSCRAAALPLAFLGLILLAGGCDFFKPQPPRSTSTDATLRGNYTRPDSTLAAIARGLAGRNRPNAQVVYMTAFADSAPGGSDTRGFHAFFDPQTVNRLASTGVTPPADWDWSVENNFYPRITSLSAYEGMDYLMVWNKEPGSAPDQIGTDDALLYREYQLVAYQSGTPDQQIAHGYATIHMVNLTGRWAIVRWDDREIPNPAAGDFPYGQKRLELKP